MEVFVSSLSLTLVGNLYLYLVRARKCWQADRGFWSDSHLSTSASQNVTTDNLWRKKKQTTHLEELMPCFLHKLKYSYGVKDLSNPKKTFKISNCVGSPDLMSRNMSGIWMRQITVIEMLNQSFQTTSQHSTTWGSGQKLVGKEAGPRARCRTLGWLVSWLGLKHTMQKQ